jgi:hypothetical protein
MQVSDDEYLESAMNVYSSLCIAVSKKKKLGDAYQSVFTLAELEELRDEAWRKVEMSTVDHIIAVHELKQELNLI